jgi:hypothetical protein
MSIGQASVATSIFCGSKKHHGTRRRGLLLLVGKEGENPLLEWFIFISKEYFCVAFFSALFPISFVSRGQLRW